MVHTRQQWQQERQRAGGAKGMVPLVSVGDLLDKFHKATSDVGKDYKTYWKRAGSAATDLKSGLVKYKANSKVSANHALVAVVDSMVKEVNLFITKTEQMRDPVNILSANFESIAKAAREIASSGNSDKYRAVYGAATGDKMKKALAAAGKALPAFRRWTATWEKQIDKSWSLDGAHLNGWQNNPGVVRAAAKHLAEIATRLNTELAETIRGEGSL